MAAPCLLVLGVVNDDEYRLRAEVRELRRDEQQADATIRYLTRQVALLQDAIRSHRDAMMRSEYLHDSDIDYRLWSVLEDRHGDV